MVGKASGRGVAGAKVLETCRKYGISDATCSKRRSGYGGIESTVGVLRLRIEILRLAASTTII